VRLPTNRGTCEMLPDRTSVAVQRLGGAEYNAAPAARSRKPTDGSRRPVGPLGGPYCPRQTGYRSVLYWASWTAAEPPWFAPPPRGIRRKRTAEAVVAGGVE
jgi:hypothetical protein